MNFNFLNESELTFDIFYLFFFFILFPEYMKCLLTYMKFERDMLNGIQENFFVITYLPPIMVGFVNEK